MKCIIVFARPKDGGEKNVVMACFFFKSAFELFRLNLYDIEWSAYSNDMLERIYKWD